MIRPICSLVLLLTACAVLAAPAPKPQPFVSGWQKPVDPDKDCTIKSEKDTLIMEMPGRDHDYNPLRGQFNAPQLFRQREIEGEFVMQVRVRIDGRPSAQSTVDGQPSSVSAGFLVVLPEKYPCVCIRVEFRASRIGSGVYGYFDVRRWFDDKGQGGGIVEGAKGRDEEWKGDAYLRLERQDGNLGFAISSDGENWKRSGAIGGVREKLKVGLAAYSTSTDPSKITFDELTIRHGEQKRRTWEFELGWGNPIDPDKDCKIKRDKDSLTIEMPGSDHDYDPVRKCFNAPRLISDLQGEFEVQVRVRIDSRPSALSTVKGQPSFVSAGFLLIYREPEYSICDRMEYAVSQLRRRLDGDAVRDAVRVQLAEQRRKEPMPKREEADHYAAMKTWVNSRQRKGKPMEWDHARPVESVNLLWERGSENWPLSEKADYAYLRLDHRMVGYSYFYISPDGEKWTRLGHLRHMPAKGKLALAAYSTSTEPSKVRFDELRLTRSQKHNR
jgi:hypothetical protein